MIYLFMILFCTFLNASMQLLMKRGMDEIGHFEFCLGNIWPLCLGILQNPYILLGIILQPISLAIWLLVISRVEVSYAFPLASLAYVFTALGGYYLLDESLSLTRILGILVIIGGVCLVARS